VKKCVNCGEEFKQYHTINNKTVRLRNRNKCLNCLPYKSNIIPIKIEIKCNNKNCNNIITRTSHQLSKTKKHFCSQSCAAIYNNKHNPKRKLTKQCKNCNNLIKSSFTYCSLCVKQGYHLRSKGFIEEKTLAEYQNKKLGSNNYRSIRDHARKITSNKLQLCYICGYKKHVETCHIKDIHKFSPNTKIKKINHPSNLILLCRNHHWELDNEYFCII
jgi:hypothetical protein